MSITFKQLRFSRISLILIFFLFCLIGSTVEANASAEKEKTEIDLEAFPPQITIRTPVATITEIRPLYSWWSTDGLDTQVLVSHAVVGTVVNEWLTSADYTIYPTYSFWLGPTHLRTGNHSWWVRERNAEGSGPWSVPWVFKIWNTDPPSGSVTKIYPYDSNVISSPQTMLIWYEHTHASWYKVYMTDAVGKLYNQYHRAAEICSGEFCNLLYTTFEPLLHAPRGLSELPTGTWIHWNVMPVNVAGNGDWTGYTKFWISSQ